MIGAAVGIGTFLTAREMIRNWNLYATKGKSVLITGGSRGLGLVLARQLVEQGANVAICARNEEELKTAGDQLKAIQREAMDPKVSTHVCDVSDRASVEKMIAEITATWGKIDVLINNAGVIQVGPMEMMDVKEYEEALSINFWGALYTSFAVLPQMRHRQEGRIVNISSIGGIISVPHLLPYSVSKFALRGFSEGLRSELKKENIIVTTVCPGLMRTGSHHNITVLGDKQKEFGWFSILGNSPLFSVNAERAAASIIRAFRQGRAELTISIPAQIATVFHGIFPGVTAEVSGLINRCMPAAKGNIGERAKGHESYSSYSPSLLTRAGDKAALRNNEK